MEKDYEFTGIGSGDEAADFDGLNSIEQAPLGEDPTSLAGMDQVSAADQAVRSECRQCASYQGGTNFDNSIDELKQDNPQRTEAEDLVAAPPHYDDDLYHTDGDYARRQWDESDNTGDPPEDLRDAMPHIR